MEFRFQCPACGQRLQADHEAVGRRIHCPVCHNSLTVPAPLTLRPEIAGTPLPGQPSAAGAATPQYTCPICWIPFGAGDVMHIAVHDSLRGDPVLGEDAPQRFLATRFNDAGQALDAKGVPCSDVACPHCRRKLPPGFLDQPHHILSIVGDQSAGKSYYLSVLTKVLPMSLYQQFGVAFQDSDPTGNAPVNDMRKILFAAQTPAQAKLAKTVFEGSMYERLPRQGRTVALPKPFVYILRAAGGTAEGCAVVFYDNAGEHFQPGINIVEQPGAQHVASAAGILFLFDPFNSPEFRRRIPDTRDPQLEKPVVDQQDIILSEMRARIQNLRNLPAGQKINTPVAFLAGKCDAWMHLLGEQPFVEPLRQGALDLADLRRNSDRVRALLRDICPVAVGNAEALSDNLAFFPVSAFGHTPVKIGPGEYVPDPARLNPVLVDIPALWILSQLCPALVRATGDNQPG